MATAVAVAIAAIEPSFEARSRPPPAADVAPPLPPSQLLWALRGGRMLWREEVDMYSDSSTEPMCMYGMTLPRSWSAA